MARYVDSHSSYRVQANVIVLVSPADLELSSNTSPGFDSALLFLKYLETATSRVEELSSLDKWNDIDSGHGNLYDYDSSVPGISTANGISQHISTRSEFENAYNSVTDLSPSAYNQANSYEWGSRSMSNTLQGVQSPLVIETSKIVRSKSVPRMKRSTRYSVRNGKKFRLNQGVAENLQETFSDQLKSDQIPCKDCCTTTEARGVARKQVAKHSITADPLVSAKRRKWQLFKKRSVLLPKADRKECPNDQQCLPKEANVKCTSLSNYDIQNLSPMSTQNFNEVRDLQDGFEDVQVSHQLLATGTSPLDSWNSIPGALNTVPAAMVPFAKSFSHSNHVTQQLEQLMIEEVQDVRPADFLAICETDGKTPKYQRDND